MAVENGDMEFNSNRIDAASDALSHALHNKLPAEIITGVLSAWIALQQFCHAIHRTTVVENMKLDELHEYCQKQFSVLNYSLEVVGLSKDKWAQALGET